MKITAEPKKPSPERKAGEEELEPVYNPDEDKQPQIEKMEIEKYVPNIHMVPEKVEIHQPKVIETIIREKDPNAARIADTFSHIAEELYALVPNETNTLAQAYERMREGFMRQFVENLTCQAVPCK